MTLGQFAKVHQKIVCIDSDGTALDTMNIKHIKCFGPCFVEAFGLQAHSEELLKRWNDINLFEATRGKNRFITLLMIMREYNGTYFEYDLAPLAAWVESGEELSNGSLKIRIERENAPILQTTLAWSESVNREIAKLTPEEKKPFEGAEEFMRYARGKADLAVVSSAGGEALRDEWARYGLDGLVDVMTSQEDGSKTQCIRRLLEKGYMPADVLMVGDSFPDIDCAEACGVWFYPILAGKETQSWNALRETFFEKFLGGSYADEQEALKTRFYTNLNVKI